MEIHPMAKKSTIGKSAAPAVAKAPAARPVARTEVRNSPVPKVAAAATPAARPVTQDLIARRAYEIWASGQGGSEVENWLRAERELRGA
jgi:hypothetical protein